MNTKRRWKPLFDEDSTDVDDARLLALKTKHVDSFSQDAMASALEDYALLAEQHRSRMAGYGGFNEAYIDEARALAVQLFEQSAGTVGPEILSEREAALDLRNRLLGLMQKRVNHVRTMTRFVFRNHPEIIRKSTSAFERRRRNESRRKKKAKAEEPEEVA